MVEWWNMVRPTDKDINAFVREMNEKRNDFIRKLDADLIRTLLERTVNLLDISHIQREDAEDHEAANASMFKARLELLKLLGVFGEEGPHDPVDV